MIKVTAAVLAAHPFLRDMPSEQLDTLAATASAVSFPAGHRIFADGGHAGRFWLIQSGSVLLDVRVPGERPIVIDSIGIGRLPGPCPARAGTDGLPTARPSSTSPGPGRS